MKDLVEMFEMDGFKFTTYNKDISFGGDTYKSIPILIDKYKLNDDDIGIKITRLMTFKKYLDGEGNSDYNAHFPKDTFNLDIKFVDVINKYKEV